MNESIVDLALSFYENEPCRICGKLITYDDLRNGAVFAGYSFNNKSRSAHKKCWDKQLPKEQWVYSQDAIDNASK